MSTITTKDGTQIYPGGTHRLGDTSKDKLNADLLAFIKS
jgi:non-heme chloroperoxidase